MDRGSKRRREGDRQTPKSVSRWSVREAEAILRAWRASGQSLLAFTRERGLNYYRVLRWRKRLAKRSSPHPSPRFYPVRVIERESPPPAGGESSAALTVVLRGDRRVVVPSGFDASTLRALVEVLERC